MKAHKFFLFLVSAALAVALFTGCSGTTSGVGSENEDSNNTNQTKPSNVQFKDYKFKVSHLPHDSEGLTVYARTIVADKYYYVDHFGKITNYTPDTCITGTVSLPAEYTKLEIVLVDMSTAVNEDDEGDAKYYALLNSDCYNAATDTYEFAGYYEIWQRTTYATQTYYGINEKDFKPIEFGKEYAFDYQTTPYLLFYADDVKRDSLKAAIQETKYTVINSSGEEREETTYTKVYWSSDITKIMSYDKDLDYLLNYNKQCKTNKVYIMVKPFYYDYKQDKGKNTEVKVTISLTENETPYFDEGEYKLKFINLPYGSDGLKIVAKGKDGSAYSTYDIGAVVSSTPEAYIEKTIEILEPFETMNFNFVDSNNIPKYYIPLTSDSYDAATGVYVMDGFYYYYYDETYNPRDPYVATDESWLKDLSYGTEYNFDASVLPYLLFKAETEVDKLISVSIDNDSECDIYLSEDKDELMTYKAKKHTTTGLSYKCKSQNVYIMLKPKEYIFGEGITQPKCSITVYDVSYELKKSLEIENAIVASNGKIYAYGTYGSNTGKSELFCIDPADNFTRTRIVNMTDEIYALSEVEPGIIYVSSEDGCITKINIATSVVTPLITDFPRTPKYIHMYKNGKLIIFANNNGATAWYLYFMDKDTGDYQEFSQHATSMQNVYYYPEEDIFFFEHAGSPADIYFLKLYDVDTADPKLYYYDSKYHGSYNIRYPTHIFKTEPLQILSPGGVIFNIDLSLTESPEYKANWCLYDNQLDISAKDFCIVGDYIYYLIYQYSDDEITVKKCALASPDTVLETRTYPEEKPVNLYKSGDKLYLLTNSQRSVISGERCYKVYLHEIDF